jgi:hypothetical protein
VKAWNCPNFGGLIDLSQRDGVDIRPTLLRVITDSYLQSPIHTAEDERQYTELALRLLDETDITTRATISARLAHEREAPRAIILQLARDVLDVAEPILKHSPVLTEADCEAVARERGPVVAEVVAQRGQPAHSDKVAARGIFGAAARHDADATPARERSDAEELRELFFAADSPERRLILLHLDYAAIEPLEPAMTLQRAEVWRLETASLRHEADLVARELQRVLGVSQALARRIVSDELGEPVVVAGKAMALPGDVLQRMILFLNPMVGHSVDRVYQLSALYNEISVDAARRLTAIWRYADPAPLRPSIPELLPWRHAAENTRRALSEISREPVQMLRREAKRAR